MSCQSANFSLEFVLLHLTIRWEIFGFSIRLNQIANLLLALGMQSLSPTSVSLPFKLLLFVAVDGWSLLSQGLILGYR